MRILTQSPVLDPSGRPFVRSSSDGPVTARELQEILAHEKYAEARGANAYAPMLQNPWTYSIIRQISQDVSNVLPGLEKRNRRRTGAYNSVQIESHPALDLIYQPNDYHKTYEPWAELCQTILLAFGNLWLWKDRKNSRGWPRALYPFGPQSVKPVRLSMRDKPIAWDLTMPNGSTQRLDLDEMVHIFLPNPYDSFYGLSPQQALQYSLDADLARLIYDRSFYRNNATPDAVLTHKPGPLTPDARQAVMESWYDDYGGPDRAGAIAVLGGEWDLKTLGIHHSQAQFIEARELTREEIASAYGFPVDLLNAQRKGGLSKDTLASARLMKYEGAVIPFTRRFFAGINAGIVWPIDDGVEFVPDYSQLPVYIDWLAGKASIYKELVQNGVPINQAIELLSLRIKPIEGGDVGRFPDSIGSIDPEDVKKEQALAAKAAKAQAKAKAPAAKPKQEAVAPVETMRVGDFAALKKGMFDYRNAVRTYTNPRADKLEAGIATYFFDYEATGVAAVDREIIVTLTEDVKDMVATLARKDTGPNANSHLYKLAERVDDWIIRAIANLSQNSKLQNYTDTCKIDCVMHHTEPTLCDLQSGLKRGLGCTCIAGR